MNHSNDIINMKITVSNQSNVINVAVMKIFLLFKQMLMVSKAILTVSCLSLSLALVPVKAHAVPVVVIDAPLIAAYTTLVGFAGSILAEWNGVLKELTTMNGWIVKDRLVVPMPTQEVVKEVVGKTPIPDLELIALQVPDAEGIPNPLFIPAITQEYMADLSIDGIGLDVSSKMCPKEFTKTPLKAKVTGMKGYSDLQDDMCQRIHALKAYKVSMAKNFKEKINEIQTAMGLLLAASLVEKTTGMNAGRQTALQTLEILEQVARAEYKAKVALADAKIVIATDMRAYAAQAILAGPPMTKALVVKMQLAKIGLSAVIGGAAVMNAPYNK
jgi:hypothetical protein